MLRYNLARKATRVRVFEVGPRVPARCGGRRRARQRGRRAPADARRRPGLRRPAEPLQWGRPERAVDFFDVKGDVEALLRRRPGSRSSRRRTRRCTPGAAPASRSMAARSASSASCTRAGASAYELPQAPILFEIDVARAGRHGSAGPRPIARHPAAWRDIAVIAGDGGHARCGDAGHHRRARRARALGTSLRRLPAGAVRAATSAPASAAWPSGSRSLDEAATLTDERIDAVVADVLAALRERLGLRLRH